MVLFPGCPCCSGDCSYIMAASRCVFTVQSFDAIEVATRELSPGIANFFQYPPSHQWTEARLFPGATYNGVYELTKIAETATRKTWEYQFSAGEFLDGTEFFRVVADMPGTAAFITVEASLRNYQFADLSGVTAVTQADFLGTPQNYDGNILSCFFGQITQPIVRTSQSLNGFFSNFSTFLTWPNLDGCQCALVSGAPVITPANCQRSNGNLIRAWSVVFPADEKCGERESTAAVTTPAKIFNYRVEFF